MSELPDEFNPLPGVVYAPEHVALAQLIVEGVVGISHKVTLIPATYKPTGKRVMTIAVFQPCLELGTVKIEPVAILLDDPSEVTEPELEHTDGDGNVKDDDDSGHTPDDAA